MGYRRRILDDLLDEVFPHLAAVAIEGAKGVGKTETALQRSKTVYTMSDPKQRDILQADTGRISQVPPPVLIDEWQLLPQVWQSVKTLVDRNNAGGQYLLTGSAASSASHRVHSGAGRIVRLVMRPMTLGERGLCTPTVSLTTLLEQTPGQASPSEITGESDIVLGDYAEEIVASGLPGLTQLPPRAARLQLDSYLARALDHDLEESGYSVRRPGQLRAWLAAYAAASASTASYTNILDAATPGESDKPTRATVIQYREALERLFLLDPLPAWIPSFAPLKRLTLGPKHHLVDPGLAARLLGVGVDDLLMGHGTSIGGQPGPLMGSLFESLAVQSVRVLAESLGARVSHLRAKGGEHEIDIIVETEGLGVLACEVKLSNTVTDRDVAHLLWLKKQMPTRVIDMVILNTGPYAYRRKDGVAVIPLALLGR
ncbi:MAG: DUF4143 domain-containing protein [Actinomycetaceae bacterium]|nr:DUF4143 domain-containing protein [Actinomycetaceae bacterium]